MAGGHPEHLGCYNQQYLCVIFCNELAILLLLTILRFVKGTIDFRKIILGH